MQALATRWCLVGALGRHAAARSRAARLSAGRGAQDGSSRAAGAGEPRKMAPPHSERGERVDVPLHAADAHAGVSSLWAIPPSRLPAEAVEGKEEQEPAARLAAVDAEDESAVVEQEKWTFDALDIEDESDIIEQKKWTQQEQEQELDAAVLGRVDEG
jgi:hypothetical protein